MIDGIIKYFVKRHLLTNMIVIAVLFGGLYSWTSIKKEEMPDITFDFVRVSAVYPGATAEEVEHFVTKELEDVVGGIDGVSLVTSTASQGSTSISIELEKGYPNRDEAITEIRNAVLDADLPEEIRDKPSVRVFKTSKKAVLDVALIHKEKHLLDTDSRQLLQQYASSLESQLTNLPQVNSVNRSGYLREEIQIDVNPARLMKYAIPLSQVMRAVRDNHVRQPAGTLEAKNEPKVTIDAQLDTVEKLQKLYVQAGFVGQAVALEDVATVNHAFALKKNIIKVNGHEAVMFNVVKNSSYGILESLEAIKGVIARFSEDHLGDVPIDLVVLDDESLDVRNRLSIIATNGGIGFCFILVMLFLFLNWRSGLWVAIGIPFTISSTLLCSMLLGYTINNITLAAVIIVMGIVVDDAIVVAENIARFRSRGFSSEEASVRGTGQVFLPVFASVITTCIAFIPLFLFSGRFGHLSSFIPPIIFIMLAASLFESLLILPAHMHLSLPKFGRGRPGGGQGPDESSVKIHWFDRVEELYGGLLVRLLPFKYIVILFFLALLGFSGWVMTQKMKFVMFPHEETREIVFSGEAYEEADRYDTAELTKGIEAIVLEHIDREVVGVRTQIAKSRRGGAVQENRFRMIVEIVPKEERKMSADALVALWKPQIDALQGFEKVVVQKSRWGHASGSPIEIVVQENDDRLRSRAVDKLVELMKAYPELTNIDIERPIMVPEYKIDFKRDKIKRLSINPADISSTFRTLLEGTVLYELPKGEEEIDVRISLRKEDKAEIDTVLDVPVHNNRDYLVPLRDVIVMRETVTPNSISRRSSKRVTTVYADMDKEQRVTPLEIAERLEREVFQKVTSDQPSTTLSFIGEVYDTRLSKGELRFSVMMVLLLIFAVLAVLFNSLTRPLIIMLAIPFGMVGVILAFWLHGKLFFGFFAAIGCLGLAGVVINDSIIMITKLDGEFVAGGPGGSIRSIAGIAQTRLKAVVLTTITTAAGVLPTAYGLAGYDAMLAEMMLALAWGLVFSTLITLLLVPCMYSILQDWVFGLGSIAQRRRQEEV
jgi:multidrug efflux pump subunit AcrB